MVDRPHLSLIAQIIDSMHEAAEKLEDAHKNQNAEIFEMAKKEILEFQKKLSEELKWTAG